MRHIIQIQSLIAALFLGFLALPAAAQTNVYLFSGAETNITLSPGTYEITAYGAQGGTANDNGGNGGLGAEMEGAFHFTTATTLTLLVGGNGGGGFNFGGGSGGGGSFVVNGSTPLIIAGGGGGGGAGGSFMGFPQTGENGGNGNTGTNGNGNGGSGGGGGDIPNTTSGGGGGGGYNGSGSNGGSSPGQFPAPGGDGGGSYLSGGTGGIGYYDNTTGGYGGGGGGGYGGGGGGGGYSGGWGGHGGDDTGPSESGAGGGSIIGSSAIVNLTEVSGVASPDDSPSGEIIITELPTNDIIILTQPSNQVVAAAQTVTFSATAFNSPPFSYQWLFNGTNIAGATSATYSISNVQSNNDGAYSVIISDSAASTNSSNANLTVVYPIQIAVQPANQILPTGSNVTFTVTATGTISAYQWYFDGTPLTDGGGVTGSISATLTLANIQTNNSGIYSVIITNVLFSTASSNATLAVINPTPVIVLPQANVGVAVNSNAVFSIYATNYYPLSFQWQFHGTNLTDGGQISGSMSSNLVISSAQDANDGYYQVIVSDSYGAITSSPVTLTVYDPVQITSQPTNLTLLSGNEATFTVVATGNALGYQWFLNGNPLTDGGNIYGSTMPTLNITNIQTSNAGSYTVLISNLFFSEISSNAVLAVYNPAQITGQPGSLDVLTGNNASFAVTATGTAIGYQWSFDGIPLTDGGQISGSATPTLTISDVQSTNFGAYSVTVSNLLSQTNSQSAYLAAPSTHYVSLNNPTPTYPYLSWSTAATNIQNAIDASISGDTIVVTDGVYQVGGETINGHSVTNRVAINKPITVQSVDGPTATVIEGNSAPPTSNSGVRCVYMTNNTALVGFTLTNGATRNSGDSINDESGGGVWCPAANNVIISNCVIIGNAAFNQGGGAYEGTLIGCMVLGNQAKNSGGGVANALVFRSLVISNAASLYYGGGAYECTVFSSAMAENYAGSYGGGAYGGTMVNCTVTGNSAGFYGGGIASCAATNSIIYYNKIFSNNSSETNWVAGTPLNYCCTTPSAGGDSITTPPVLADIAHISLNSPCRQAGNPSVTNGVDIDGNPWGNPPSIGCSEIPSTGDYGNLAVNISTAFTNWAPGYPLYFQATISGPDYMTIWNFGDGTIVTNAPYLTHVWSSTGNYPVTLTAFNDSFPTGVTATLMINIAVPTNCYVNLANPNPVPPYSYWSIAATNIQDAVGVAAPGSVVMVTNPSVVISPVDQRPYTNTVAIYQYGGAMAPVPNHPFYRVCATNPITIESVNGPATTYIVGQPFGLAGCVYLTNGAALIGFTLTNGSSFNGGGIYAAATNVIITNCVIEQCSSSRGEAVYSGILLNCLVTNSETGAYESVLNNCTLLGNSGIGEKDCVLNNCVISNNAGGGAYGGILNNCFITHNSTNYGGGAYADGGDPIVLNNCVIKNNSAQYGGGAFGTSSRFAILNNCIVVSNTAAYAGGGVYQAQLNNCLIISNRVSNGSGGGGNESTLVNCTVAFNSAGTGGGIINCTADNCILYYNTGGDYTSPYTLNYCCSPVLPANGLFNITSAPLFVNAAGNDFHLQSGSPCINSGNNIYVSTATDLDGNPRIVGGTVDIGAYEYQTPATIISYAYLQQYGLPTDGSVDFADLDGTGFNVYQDWIAGLNPTNSASVLVMVPVTTTNTTAGITVSWQSVSGILYNLQRTTNLPAAFSTIQSNITGNAGTTSYTDGSATNGIPYFYRVGVQAP